LPLAKWHYSETHGLVNEPALHEAEANELILAHVSVAAWAWLVHFTNHRTSYAQACNQLVTPGGEDFLGGTKFYIDSMYENNSYAYKTMSNTFFQGWRIPPSYGRGYAVNSRRSAQHLNLGRYRVILNTAFSL